MNIIASYEYVEGLLADFLQIVPFEAADPAGQMQPNAVWSPRLATILQEACSQIDSCCRHELDRAGIAPKRNEHNLDDYFANYGSWLAVRKLVFWQDENGEPVKLQPYREWVGAVAVRSPSWWAAYNKVKHDRLRHRKLASLKNCVEALAGLFLVIMRLAGKDDRWRGMLSSSNWWRNTASGTAEIAEDTDQQIWGNVWRYNVVETRLFSFPLGWWHDEFTRQCLLKTNGREKYWGGLDLINKPGAVGGSDRWQFWFNQWFDGLEMPFTAASQFTPLLAIP